MRRYYLTAIAICAGLLLCFAFAASYVSERQAIINLGLYPTDDERLSPGAMIVIDWKGKSMQAMKDVSDICTYPIALAPVELPERRYTVSWRYEFIANLLPWPTSQEFFLSDIKSVSAPILLENLFNDPTCEERLGALVGEHCLVIVTEQHARESGTDLVAVSRCQLINVDDSLSAARSVGSGQRQTDRYFGVGFLERTWHSFRQPFMQVYRQQRE